MSSRFTDPATANQAFIEQFLALINAFLRSEGAPLREAALAQTAKEDAATREMAATIREVGEVVDETLDSIMAVRLAANQRDIPLAQETDVARIVSAIFEGVPMSAQMVFMTAIVQPIAASTILNNNAFLSAIDDDHYAAFWKFVNVMTAEAVRSGQPLFEVATSAESRAHVYRSYMTYQAWRKLTTIRSRTLRNLANGRTWAGLAEAAPSDASRREIERHIIDAQETSTARGAEVERTNRNFYTKLGQEIWPVGSRN